MNSFSPPFLAYFSGHATFGAAQAGVLAEFFGADRITFTIDTFTIDSEDSFYNALPIHGPRTFHRLSDAAIKNGLSRIYLARTIHQRTAASTALPLAAGVARQNLSSTWQTPRLRENRLGWPSACGSMPRAGAQDRVGTGDLLGFLLAYSSSG